MPFPYKTTVSVAASSRDLTVLETVKAELKITNSDSDEDLARLISDQSAVAVTFLRRELAQETLVDSFRVWCATSAPLLLSRRPLVSITSIVEDGETLTTDDYEIEAETGFVWRLDGDDNRSCWAPCKVVVTFVAGYDLLTTLPRDIERGVLALIKRSYFSASRDPMAKAEEVEGIGRTEYWVGSVPGADGLPAETVALLAPYRDESV